MKHKFLWDFEIQTDHLFQARRPEQEKESLSNSGLCLVGRPQSENQRKESDKYLNLARELKRRWNMKVAVIPFKTGALETIHKGLIRGDGRVGNRRISRDHPNYSIIKIVQNTETSPGNLRWVGVIQTAVKDHQQTLVWKTLKAEEGSWRNDNNNNNSLHYRVR